MRLVKTSVAILAVTTMFVAACAGGTSAPTGSPSTPKAETTEPTTAAPSQTKTGSGQASPQAATTSGKASGEPVKIGMLCDRSGAVANINIPMCDGMNDWFEYLNNAGGGVKGRPVETFEIDMKYEVPVGVDGYKRMTTRDGIRQIVPLATPLVDALAPASAQDKVVLWSPGFGLSDVREGEKFPYVFAGVATYHSQALAIMQYIADKWTADGNTGNPKVVYLYYDNPAGRDPLELIQREASIVGLDLIDTIAVPATTVDMTTIMTQVKDMNPDYVMAHLFGRTPALALQAANKVGYPVDRMVGFVWAFSEDDARVAGPAAVGYQGVVFHAHYSDNPKALQMIEEYWQQTGQQPHPRSREVLHYVRGLMIAQLMAEGARLADDPNSGESLKKGIETMTDFTANEMLPGTTLTPENHAGSRQVRVYQVIDDKGTIKLVRDWFEGPEPSQTASG